GGQGLVVLLEGAFRSLKGEPVEGWEMELIVPVGTVQRPLASVREEYLAATEEELYGYCAQFLIQGQDLDQDAIRARLDGLAQSTVVVGNESMVKVHVHVADPEPLMDYARSLGELSQVSIDNIDEQHQEFIAGHRQRRVMAVAVVAVGWGQGFVRLFRDLGAAAVVVCQETMNPSIQELLAAVEATAAQRVIVLPNNDNAVPAASQMASLASRPVHVIPTGTLPQGVAALLAFNPEEGLEANLKTMEQAVSGVRTLEVTRAVRPVSIGGVEVGEGQTIALLEGTLAAAGDSLPEVVQDALTRVGPGKGSLVTLYYGAGVSQEEAGQLAAYLRQNLPQVEVETVHGDQPHYSYLISIE
ncbi:MAG: DAK2 domain-containing protein, partial [Dehalococcoidia bacterium]